MSIQVMLSGGLGNQLFQYAAGYALAQKLSTGLVIDTAFYNHDDLRSYELGTYPIKATITTSEQMDTTHRVHHGLRPLLEKALPAPLFALAKKLYRAALYPVLKKAESARTYEQGFFHFDENFFDLPDNTKLIGTFQSERYFKSEIPAIRAIFSKPNNLSPEAITMAQQIKSAPMSVSLHVRRGDYLLAKHKHQHAILQLEYYQRALSMIQGITGQQPTCFVFTDDVEFVTQNFKTIHDLVCVSAPDMTSHDDLHLMSQCQHNIIGNSSFSWWGAWLNPSDKKIVIAPRQWFTTETLRERNIADLFPEGWILL